MLCVNISTYVSDFFLSLYEKSSWKLCNFPPNAKNIIIMQFTVTSSNIKWNWNRMHFSFLSQTCEVFQKETKVKAANRVSVQRKIIIPYPIMP